MGQRTVETTVPSLIFARQWCPYFVIWIGHSTEGITDKYALEGVKPDTMFRTMVQKAGLGFDLGRFNCRESL